VKLLCLIYGERVIRVLNNNNKLGARIKEIRKKNNLTQNDFGKLFNLNDSTISLYESNKRTPEYDILVRIADKFNVTTDWLLGRVEEPDLIIHEGTSLPYNLKEIGVEYLKLCKEIQNKEINPQDLLKIINVVKDIKKNQD